jgi:inorganic pyrophosphatase
MGGESEAIITRLSVKKRVTELIESTNKVSGSRKRKIAKINHTYHQYKNKVMFIIVINNKKKKADNTSRSNE